jgi:hypothetical protein
MNEQVLLIRGALRHLTDYKCLLDEMLEPITGFQIDYSIKGRIIPQFFEQLVRKQLWK